MLTLFCLGNPTLKHKFNRHNAGLLLGEFLIEKMDLGVKKFKNYTSPKNNMQSSAIIMGKNTFLSLKKPLPNRMNFVVSSSLTKKHSFYNGFHFFNTFE